MENLWRGTVSAGFGAIRPKLCGNCAFPQTFHTRKLGEITVIYAVLLTLYFIKAAFIAFSFEQEPHIICLACLKPFGAT